MSRLILSLLLMSGCSGFYLSAAYADDSAASANDHLQASDSASETKKMALALNNAGVKKLAAMDFYGAIEKLEEALKLIPQYTTARKNLAIAYNNYGLVLRNQPERALRYFHKAYVLDADNEVTRLNINGCLRLMKKDPLNFDCREQLAKDAYASGDYEGAIAEYTVAIKLKDEPELRVKLGEANRALLERAPGEKNSAVVHPPNADIGLTAQAPAIDNGDGTSKSAESTFGKITNIPKAAASASAASTPVADFKPFMIEVNRRIKKVWSPPKEHHSERARVLFSVNSDGTVRASRLLKSSGLDEVDQQALKAVQKAAPFPKLPDGAPAFVDVDFVFDYNVVPAKPGSSAAAK